MGRHGRKGNSTCRLHARVMGFEKDNVNIQRNEALLKTKRQFTLDSKISAYLGGGHKGLTGLMYTP